jgi:hypothetical protein
MGRGPAGPRPPARLRERMLRYHARGAPVAQWIERPPPKRQVIGSTPIRGTIFP